jgi:hypothetical protein
MAISKFIAKKIINHVQVEKSLAYTFGDQRPVFGKKFLAHLKKIPKTNFEREDLLVEEEPLTLEEFFHEIGYSEVCDIDYNGKAKFTFDLGQPLPNNLKDTGSFLYDGGTIEHIPNVYQALCNAASILKVGGIIFHNNPCAQYSGAYYSINPELLRDFYERRGFETLECLVYRQKALPFYKKIKPDVFMLLLERNGFIKPRGKYDNNYGRIFERYDGLQIWPDPFDLNLVKRICRQGIPRNMHVLYIAKKVNRIDDQKCIADPVPECYPSVIE